MGARGAGIVGFDMDVRGLASLEPGFQGLDKVQLARDAMLEAAKRLSNPLHTLAFWSSVRQQPSPDACEG